jgi:hypothetical protein
MWTVAITNSVYLPIHNPGRYLYYAETHGIYIYNESLYAMAYMRGVVFGP